MSNLLYDQRWHTDSASHQLGDWIGAAILGIHTHALLYMYTGLYSRDMSHEWWIYETLAMNNISWYASFRDFSASYGNTQYLGIIPTIIM